MWFDLFICFGLTGPMMAVVLAEKNVHGGEVEAGTETVYDTTSAEIPQMPCFIFDTGLQTERHI